MQNSACSTRRVKLARLMLLRLISLLGLAAASHATVTCAFGQGSPAKQPSEQTLLTCAPPATVGSGNVTIHAEPSRGMEYLDAKVFQYHPAAPPKSRGLVSVAAVAIEECDSDPPPFSAEERYKLIFKYIAGAAASGADLAVLPEYAFGGEGAAPPCNVAAEAVTGNITTAVRQAAKKYNINVIFTLDEIRQPTGKKYNTAVVIDRQGALAGTYSKIMPVFGNASQTVPLRPGGADNAEVDPPSSITPSSEGVRVFDLDFGRVAVLICFDINFAE